MNEEEGKRRHLELKNEGRDGFRYYLAGEPLHAGDLLEIELDKDSWQRVRFEWSYDLQDKPQLFLPNDSRTIALSPSHQFRKGKQE